MALEYEFSSDVETVFELLTDPDFLVQRSMDLGELGADCEVTDEDTKTTVTMTREVERDLPAFLAKLFNPCQTVEMVEEWEKKGEKYLGHLDFDIVGQPVVITANFDLKPKGDGCVYSISYSPKAKIPMIGKKVEKFILSQTEDGVLKELEYAGARLG